MKVRGKFITIDGGEGVGKSTNRSYLAAALQARGVPLRLTREPGGTQLGEQLRDLLLTIEGDPPVPAAELLMIFAARAQHLENVIEPALAGGEWVLCDRFTDATFAYQGAGRGLDGAFISALETLVQGNRQPDLTVILDVDPEVGMQRAVERGELDRFERESLPFFRRVRQAYLERAKALPHRYRLIDAGESLQQVQRALDCIVTELIE
ncbi:dTMP kinase [Flavobacteriaceae bacterium]|nr:dTMP kinase [Flavobacteriaceae bacterium]